jgi:hypothetical protein
MQSPRIISVSTRIFSTTYIKLSRAPPLVVPKENYIIKQPVFFGGGHEDYVCVPKAMLFTMKDVCPNLTVREYQTGHVCDCLPLRSPDADPHGINSGFSFPLRTSLTRISWSGSKVVNECWMNVSAL